jgi:hypothetical protein
MVELIDEEGIKGGARTRGEDVEDEVRGELKVGVIGEGGGGAK